MGAAADRALLLPRGAAAAGALPADPRPWTARLRDDPPCTWWQRLRGGCTPWRTVLVSPLRADGAGLAPPAALRLPPAQLDIERRQGLAPAPAPHVGAAAADSQYFSYNSSAMTPLVPLWAAWMTDASRMANRSHGLDFEARPAGLGAALGAAGGRRWLGLRANHCILLITATCRLTCLPPPPTPPCPQTAWRLSSYVAISYCNASTIADWSCSRCNGISADVEPEEVRGHWCSAGCRRIGQRRRWAGHGGHAVGGWRGGWGGRATWGATRPFHLLLLLLLWQPSPMRLAHQHTPSSMHTLRALLPPPTPGRWCLTRRGTCRGMWGSAARWAR